MFLICLETTSIFKDKENMSRLEELIQKLCPEGIGYKTLGEIATDVFRGAGITRDQVRETGTPCVRYGEIYTTYGIWFEDCVSHTDESLLASKKYFGYGDILFAITGESVDEIAKCCAYIGHETCLAGGDIVVLRHNEDPKYLAYALSTLDAQKQKSKGKVKSKVVHSSVPDIKSIRIPVPPLEVQREIVRILDTFTELTSELTENLSKEFTARKQQYTYYRNKLLEKNTKAMKMKLGDIFDFQNGFAFKSRLFKESGNAILRIANIKENQISTDNLVFFDEADYKENLSSYIVRQNDIVIAMSGATTGKIGVNIAPYNFYLNQRVGKFIPKENIVLSRYSYHLLLQMSEEIYAISEGGAQPNLSSEKLKKLTAYIPPISEQKRIVKVLDTFAFRCTDLTSGLPAEIEARKKQYEYYRDKLLTFGERFN